MSADTYRYEQLDRDGATWHRVDVEDLIDTYGHENDLLAMMPGDAPAAVDEGVFVRVVWGREGLALRAAIAAEGAAWLQLQRKLARKISRAVQFASDEADAGRMQNSRFAGYALESLQAMYWQVNEGQPRLRRRRGLPMEPGQFVQRVRKG